MQNPKLENLLSPRQQTKWKESTSLFNIMKVAALRLQVVGPWVEDQQLLLTYSPKG